MTTGVLPTPWTARPVEEARLLNPAFIALLLKQAADGHQQSAARPMPWALAFLVLPVVLHRPTRDRLPSAVSTSMARWVQDHPDLRLLLAGRARALAPPVREGLIFGVGHGLLGLDEQGCLAGRSPRHRSPGEASGAPTDDFRDCNTKAKFMGRWCARSGAPATVFALWGVRP